MGDYSGIGDAINFIFHGFIAMTALSGILICGGLIYGCHEYREYKAKKPIEYRMTSDQLSALVQQAGGTTNNLQSLIQQQEGD